MFDTLSKIKYLKVTAINNCWHNLISNFFLRMMVSGILLSVGWGTAIYVYQSHQVKKELFLQLEKASQNITDGQFVPFNTMDIQIFDSFIKQSKRRLTDFRIIGLDIYDTDHHGIFHYDSGPEAIELIKNKKTGLKPSSVSDQDTHSFYKIHDEIYYQILSPVYGDQKHLGSVGMTVIIGPKIVRQFKRALIFAVLHAIGTISTMALILYPLIHASYRKLQRSSRELLESHLYTIKVLGNAIAERDSDTDEHNYRVTYFSLCLAEHLNLSAQSLQSLVKGAFLHDIGKIGIRDHILLKPTKLSIEEFAIMKTHVEQGVKIVNDIPWLRDSKDVIQYHHERYDGSGYPLGLVGEQIPIVARIFAVADVFDALISKRPYKPAASYVDAIKILKQQCRQFDPLVFFGFMEISESLFCHASSMGKTGIEVCLATKLADCFKL